MAEKLNKDTIKNDVKKHYSDAIQVAENKTGGCCSSAVTAGKYAKLAGYSEQQLSELPAGISVTSFGCGNPVDMLEMKEGDVVLDLGCGPGLDLFLAAKSIGSTGKAIGLDMTPAMLAKARENIKKSGLTNVEVREGEMEDMPVDDNSVDWVISNCVINLSPDKQKVFSEITRVLKPGGKMMVSDIVATGDIPDEIKNDKLAWSGCMGGALPEQEYLQLASDAGLIEVSVVNRLVYDRTQMAAFTTACCSDEQSDGFTEAQVDQLAGKLASVKVTGTKK
ncbi:MAG: arsenite methyltransferase [candidate division Zixibacteria bacterium]|nr:arsenite methyltransferase [candidate division Zixibacteria bacterium]